MNCDERERSYRDHERQVSRQIEGKAEHRLTYDAAYSPDPVTLNMTMAEYNIYVSNNARRNPK